MRQVLLATVALVLLHTGAYALHNECGGNTARPPCRVSCADDTLVRGGIGISTSMPLRLCGGKPMKEEKRQVTSFQLAGMVVVWYALNVGWNLSNKNLCNLLKLPMTATALQMCLGSLFITSQWVFKRREMPDPSLWRHKHLMGLGVAHAFAQLSTITAFSIGSVSFVSVIKSLEPLFSAAIGVPVLGDRLPLRIWLSMMPVCAGIAMASISEVAFTWQCFWVSQLSNVCYALRSVWFKKVFDEASKDTENGDSEKVILNTSTGFPVVALIGTALVVTIAVLTEGHRFAEGIENVHRGSRTVTDLFWLVATAGFFQYTNDEMSFAVLEVLSAVTQSVANTFKRVFVITAAAYYFNTPVSNTGIVGTGIAVAGMVLYSIIMDGHRADQKTKIQTLPARMALHSSNASEQRKGPAYLLKKLKNLKRTSSWIP
mmetsp:Transcript_66149/g.96864  ORF Transcript_66149/g.96864 Transcript_66149/m.96864 type:complete len:430 (+) Transcript_66149:22-1311(+)